MILRRRLTVTPAVPLPRPRTVRIAVAPMALAVALALPAAVAPAGAVAQEDAIEEIVVTARRAAESLSDVPIAVTAFTEAEIEDAGIQRPEDFIALTPNVVMADTANTGDTLVTIRGITSTRDAESNFALVVDGVLITNPNAFNRELLDVAQIEVLKGPQGALYGRNASSGAILITTREPSETFEGYVTGGAGNNDSYRLQGAVSGAITENLRGRLSASHRETDGFFRNTFLRENNVDFFEDDTVRGRLIYETGATTWDLRTGFSQSDSGTINFNATFALPAFTSFGTPGAEAFFLDVNEHDFRYIFNVPPSNEQETRDVSLKMDHEFGNGLALTGIFAYNDLEESLLSDGTSAAFGGYSAVPACAASVTPETIALVNSAPPQFLFAAPGEPPTAANSLLAAYTPLTCDGYQYQERNQSDVSLELRLAGPTDTAVRWLVGGYVADIDREVVVGYGADLGQGFVEQPFVPASGPNPTDLLFWDEFDTRVYSVFGQVGIDLREDLELSLEGRFDREEREVENQVPRQASALLFGGGGPLNPARTTVDQAIPSRSEDFEQFQPRVALRWDTTLSTSLYASYGVGFRSGGFNSLGSEAITEFWFNSGDPFGLGSVGAGLDVNDEYDKEVSQALEVGLKGNYLEGRLTLNAAVFQTDVDDNQFFEFFAGPFGLLRVVTTIDELQLRGAEMDFAYLATDNLKLYGGVGITDGEIEENRHRPATEGNEAPLAPEYTLNLGAQWQQGFANGLNLVVRLDYGRVGETWFHTVQDNRQPAIWTSLLGFPVSSDTSQTKRDPYDIVDLRVSLHGQRWTVTGWGRNLGDEDYLEEVIVAPEFGGSFIHEAPEDSYGVDFTYRF
jgi:iron complex outermembrane receptor protein